VPIFVHHKIDGLLDHFGLKLPNLAIVEDVNEFEPWELRLANCLFYFLVQKIIDNKLLEILLLLVRSHDKFSFYNLD
jgi:hypothetical protein